MQYDNRFVRRPFQFAAILMIATNLPTYMFVGDWLGFHPELVAFTYFVVISLSVALITGLELRKWLARTDDDPAYDPTQNASKQHGKLVGDVATNH